MREADERFAEHLAEDLERYLGPEIVLEDSISATSSTARDLRATCTFDGRSEVLEVTGRRARGIQPARRASGRAPARRCDPPSRAELPSGSRWPGSGTHPRAPVVSEQDDESPNDSPRSWDESWDRHHPRGARLGATEADPPHPGRLPVRRLLGGARGRRRDPWLEAYDKLVRAAAELRLSLASRNMIAPI